MKKLFGLIIGLVLMASVAFGATTSLTFLWSQDLGAIDPATNKPVAFTGWKLYQSSVAGGPYTPLATIPFEIQKTEYTSTQSIVIQDGIKTILYIVLTAYNDAGESGYSNEASGTFDLTVKPPGTPTNFKLIIPLTTKKPVTKKPIGKTTNK